MQRQAIDYGDEHYVSMAVPAASCYLCYDMLGHCNTWTSRSIAGMMCNLVTKILIVKTFEKLREISICFCISNINHVGIT